MAAHHPDGSPVPAVRTYLGVAAAPVGGHGARDWVVSVLDDTGCRSLTLHSRHSPTGHSWGYAGSGPAQLALDLLWDVLDAEPTRPLYQRFKFEIVAHWPQDGDWSISATEVLAWLDAATEAGE